MLARIWVFSFGFCLSALTSYADTSERVDALFAKIDNSRPGVAVAVVQNTEVVYLKSFGLANLEHNIPITSQTVFDIASISKQFGGLATILLEADGKLSFDDEVTKYVPELEVGRGITLQHLLNHTGGLRDWPQTLKIAGVEMDDTISFEKILRMLEFQTTLNFEPGSAYAYSNTGYNLLAEALQRITGKTFRELTDEAIFQPLGMHSTLFLDNTREVIPNLASSYAQDEDGNWVRVFDQLTALASSSLHTNIEDFTRWMINFESKAVGGTTAFDKLTTRGVLNDGTEIPYARGIVNGVYRGLPIMTHGGSWAGFRTIFFRFPEQQFSIAVFANFAGAEPGRLAQKIADIYLEDQLAPPTEPVEKPSEETELYAPEDLSVYEGEYYSTELDTTYTLNVTDDGLEARHVRNEPVRLTPTAEDAFKGDAWWMPEIHFLRDEGGAIEALELNAVRVKRLRFEKRGPLLTP